MQNTIVGNMLRNECEEHAQNQPPIPSHAIPILSVFLGTRGACVEACWTLLMGVEARRVVTY